MAVQNEEYDEDWRTERLHLLVRSAAETERRTLPANIAGTLLVIGAAQSLPNAADFYIPMLLRFLALFATALLYETIRRRLDGRAKTLVPMRMASAVAAFGWYSGKAPSIAAWAAPVATFGSLACFDDKLMADSKLL